jgi:predicted GNAT family N-acyltransferase
MNTLEEKLEVKIAKAKKDIKTCLDIRNAVFIEEQNVPPKRERDGKEEICTHFLALLDEKPVGTGRFFKRDDNSAKITHVAVLPKYRGKQIGKKILNAIIEHSKKCGISTLILSSQSYVIGFYEGFGFKAEGEEFLDANIPHKMMRLDITKQ